VEAEVVVGIHNVLKGLNLKAQNPKVHAESHKNAMAAATEAKVAATTADAEDNFSC
jgi:hypothetical protein